MKYTKIVGEEEYFSTWERENLEQLTPELRKSIYNKYLTKCNVFQRDGFTCQNEKCKTPDSGVTLHHIKWQKNGGEDKPRNGLTLCVSCHKGFHARKHDIVVKDRKELPAHVRGHTIKLHKDMDFNWKAYRETAKKIRRENRQYYGVRVNWYMVAILMQWLSVPYYEMRHRC